MSVAPAHYIQTIISKISEIFLNGDKNNSKRNAESEQNVQIDKDKKAESSMIKSQTMQIEK